MKKSIPAALLAACLLTAPCAAVSTVSARTVSPSAATAASAARSTAPSNWAAADIQTAIKAGLVPSSLTGQWKRPITRVEFADLMTQLLHSRGYAFGAVTTVNPFLDTFSENARRLCDLGVMSGTNAASFSPDGKVTREEAAACVYRLARTKYLPNPYPEQIADYAYADQDKISSDAVTPVSFCARSKILGGAGSSSFAPQGTLTVEQSVLVMLRLSQYAKAMAPTPMTMTAGGYPMLYSNDPEILVPKVFETTGIYTAETDLTDGQTIDTEYYHCSYMGSYQPMILGIVATNSGTSEASLDIVKRGVGIGTDGTSVSEQCYQRFFQSTGEASAKLAAGETRLIVQDTLPGGSILNARVRLTPHGDHLNIRLVALKKLIDPQYLATLPRGLDDTYGRTAGVFRASERTLSVDTSSVQNFTLCGNNAALRALNPGEFPQSISDPLAVSYHGLAHMSYFIDGNFATVYHLDFKNAAGKTLYIRPNDPATKTTPGHYFLYTAKEGWHAVSATMDSPAAIPLSDGTSMDFLMLGGNYGNIGFHIV